MRLKRALEHSTGSPGASRGSLVEPEMLPLSGLRFSLVGPGRVGLSLAQWLEQGGAELVSRAGRGEVGSLVSGGQDLLLLAVPDGALPEVAARLALRPQAAVVLHTSGSQDASPLAPMRAGGSAVGSLHPLKAFPHPLPDAGAGRGVFFALDGDPAALAFARRLVDSWGGVAGEVPGPLRPLYHLAASLAAGGVVTLVAAASEIAASLGLPQEIAGGYLELARGALAVAAAGGGPAQNLTGPVARGDLLTLDRALDGLATSVPEKLPLVLEVARETLHQLARLTPLSPRHEELARELARRAALVHLPDPRSEPG